jgi:hypothetical protein
MSRLRFFVDSARLRLAARCACRAALGLTLLLLPACARDLVAENAGWRSTRGGYSIGTPGAGWERFDLEGAALALRRGGSESMSLQARCGHPVASPAIMARHLMIGIPERTLRQAGPTTVAGRSAWAQTFDARVEGRAVRIQSVTMVASGCAYDFLLVAAGDPESAQREFEAWVESFSLPALDTAGSTP